MKVRERLDSKIQKKDFDFDCAKFRSLRAFQVEISKAQWKYLGCSYTCERGCMVFKWMRSFANDDRGGKKIEKWVPMIWESESFREKRGQESLRMAVSKAREIPDEENTTKPGVDLLSEIWSLLSSVTN